MAKKTNEEVPVLPNQTALRIINPVNTEKWEHVGGKMYMIPLVQFTEHPQNSEIYKTSQKDDEELRHNIELHGVLSPVKAVLRYGNEEGEELRLLSGHRRVKTALEIGKQETVLCEVETDLTDEKELLLLYACNVGRGMEIAAKIRYFEGLMQFLSQFRQGDEIQLDNEEDNAYLTAFVRNLDESGIKVTNGRLRDVLVEVTGFSTYEVELLTQVCSLRYRENLLNRIRSFKNGGKKQAEKLEKELIALRNAVVNGDMTLTEAASEIKRVNKIVQASEKGGKMPPVEKAKEKDNKKAKNTDVNTVLDTVLNEKIDSITRDVLESDWGVKFDTHEEYAKFYDQLKWQFKLLYWKMTGGKNE